MTFHQPKNIFVLRNNDLGDVLVTTPLLAGLRKAFPKAKISIGVGDWAQSLLENNPDLDEVINCNAPWHNKQNCNFPANSPKTFLHGLLYVILSEEARKLSKGKFSHGLDILGSRQGSWLLRRAKITNRFGVRGYAGGDNWCKQCVDFKEDRSVIKSGLAFLKLMDVQVDVEARPIISLKESEIKNAENLWGEKQPNLKRIVIAPGGGFPMKCWGNDHFTELVYLLLKEKKLQVCILGSQEDRNRIKYQKSLDDKRIQNLCGTLNLRKSAAFVSRADFVFTNSSLCMHLAGAFKIPSISLLGEWYDSAKLHQKQWGYIESQVLGKEISIGKNRIVSATEAYACFENTLKN